MPASRRDELVDAAMRVFCREGFQGTSVDRVLEEGGFSRMTLYNHFRSKDDLIVAALRRQDEISRARMHRFVEARSEDPRSRILAVFDYLGSSETEGFRGCPFTNAAAEYTDPESPVRRVACEHKRAIVCYFRELCESAGLERASELGEQLSLLFDGAIVAVQVVGCVDGSPCTERAAERARDAAATLIGA